MARVLVVGSGGREHALCWKFSKSEHVETVYCAPGNDGMTDVATCVNIPVSDFHSLIRFAKEEDITLTFVGPEVPLVEGIVDAFEKEGLTIFGPRANAAILEGSKAFSKDIMKKYNIPTAKFETFYDYEQAKAYLMQQTFPVVLKADGLAAGKGVVIAQSLEEALACCEDMMCNNMFGNAGATLVIEEFLEGEEFSLLAFVHNDQVYPLPIAQDHKRAYDHDAGPNTGGMGAYTPVKHIPQSAIEEAMNCIMVPMCKAMMQEGRSYEGILYGGLMLTKDGVKTIEFNCRFGDPETEVILQALQGDLFSICMDVLAGKAPTYSVNDRVYLGVVMASTKYPESSTKNVPILHVDEVSPTIFHMGTKLVNGDYVTNGGRVLFVSAEGETMEQAYTRAYEVVRSIQSDALFYRNDIGYRAMKGK